jgi:PAS domain S-box-containing protein
MSVPEVKDMAELYGVLFSAIPDIVCVFGFDGRFGLVNPAWSSVLGFSPDRIPGRFYLEFVHPDDLRHSALAFRRLSTGERTVVWHNRYACKDGGYRRLQWHATADVERRQIYAVARDVSDLTVNEDMLSDTELKSVSTIESAMEGIIRTSPSGQIMMANPAAVRLLGYESDVELMSQVSDIDRAMFADPEDRAVIIEHLAHESVVDLECELRRKDGAPIHVAMKVRAVRHASGVLAYHEKFLTDITAMKQLEESVQASETQYRSLVENAPFGIYRSSLDGKFLDVNHSLVAMLGYESREEVMSLNIEADVYLQPDMRSRLVERFGNTERIESVNVDWKRKDGTSIIVRLSARKIRDASGVLQGFEVIAEDTRATKPLPA